MNPISLLAEGSAAVRCSVLLGIVDWSWFGFWRWRSLEFMMLGECVVLYLCVRVLVEEYRERKENRRQSQQGPCKADKSAVHLFSPCGCDVCKSRNLGIEERRFFDNERWIVVIIGLFLVKARNNIINLFAKLFFVSHKNGIAQMPNEQGQAHPEEKP